VDTPLSFPFPQEMRLKKKGDFSLLQKNSKRKVGSFICLDAKEGKGCKLGISASKKYGSSVERNRFKRLVREAFRMLAPTMQKPLLLHIVPRQKAKNATMHHIRKEMLELINHEPV
jgi:ribonuclease P protein component